MHPVASNENNTKGESKKVFSLPPVGRCMVAFTLAEVLITLGIIGVVAAMTLPTLVNKYQERVTVTKVKKFYSVMNQALLMAIKDNGYVDEWDFLETDEESGQARANKLISYIKPYLKISKDCGVESGCLEGGYYKLLNDSNFIDYDSSKNYYKMILADGSYMWIRRMSGTNICAENVDGFTNACGFVWIDVNGKNPPNTMGKDTFTFAISKSSLGSSTDDCTASGRGFSCASYILTHGDMKYLYK